jgi:hypothetical protein
MNGSTDHAPTTLGQVLDQAEASHADDPAATFAALRACAASLPADADGARALRLAEHVALAHLGDAAPLAALLQAVPPALGQHEATAPMLERLHWALALVGGTPAPRPPPDAMRWRALQNVVLALATQGRCAEAGALLAADEAAARAHGQDEAGAAYAACANNVALELQTRAVPAGAHCDTPRDAPRDALMLQAAAIARRAWGHAGNWRHVERAEYRLAVCHAAAGQGALALHHARLCLAGCEAAGVLADAVEHFFAHEALARALQAAGDVAAAQAERQQMAMLLPQIDAADGLRDWCAEALAALPG